MSEFENNLDPNIAANSEQEETGEQSPVSTQAETPQAPDAPVIPAASQMPPLSQITPPDPFVREEQAQEAAPSMPDEASAQEASVSPPVQQDGVDPQPGQADGQAPHSQPQQGQPDAQMPGMQGVIPAPPGAPVPYQYGAPQQMIPQQGAPQYNWQQNGMAPAGAVPPKKSGKVLGIVLGCAILAFAALGIGLGVLMMNSPENVVKSALMKTFSEQEKAVEQLYRDLPALRMSSFNSGPSRYEADFSFESLDEYSQEMVMASLLRGAGIKGSYVNIPETKTEEFQGSIYFGTTDLLDIYGYADPNALGAAIPSFSETVIAVHPQTLVAEIVASPLGDYVDAGILRELQNSADTLMNSERVDLTEASKQMQKDMLKLLEKDVPGLTYKRGPEENGRKTYIVSAPGDEVKAFLTHMMEYVMLESPIKEFYRSAFTPLAQEMNGMSYERFVNQSIGIWEQNLSPLALEAKITVQGGRVYQIDASLTPSGRASQELDITGIRAKCEYIGSLDTKMDVTVNMMMQGQKVDMSVFAQTMRGTDKSYEVQVDCDISADGINVYLEGDSSYGTDGLTVHQYGITASEGSTPIVRLGADISGKATVNQNGKSIQMDYNKLGFSAEGMGFDYTIWLKGKIMAEEISKDYIPSRSYTYVADMTDAELDNLMREYEAGADRFYTLLGDALSVMYDY